MKLRSFSAFRSERRGWLQSLTEAELQQACSKRWKELGERGDNSFLSRGTAELWSLEHFVGISGFGPAGSSVCACSNGKLSRSGGREL